MGLKEQVDQMEMQWQKNLQRLSHLVLWYLMPCFCPSDGVGFWFLALTPSAVSGLTKFDPCPTASSSDPKSPRCLCKQKTDMLEEPLARYGALYRGSNGRGTLGMSCESFCSICGMCHNAMDMRLPYPPWLCWFSVRKSDLWSGGNWALCAPSWGSSHLKVALLCDVDTNLVWLGHALCVLSSAMSKLMAQSWAKSKMMTKIRRMSKIEHINWFREKQWQTAPSWQIIAKTQKAKLIAADGYKLTSTNLAGRCRSGNSLSILNPVVGPRSARNTLNVNCKSQTQEA